MYNFLDGRTMGLCVAAMLLVWVLFELVRHPTLGEALAGRRKFAFVELEELLTDGTEVLVQNENDEKGVNGDVVAARLRSENLSVRYFRSMHPKGKIETMDILHGRQPLFLKFESDICVGYSSAPPFRFLHPIKDIATQRCTNAFGERVRQFVP